jgi:MFS transporter, DHA1 family, inner membrane transport protein
MSHAASADHTTGNNTLALWAMMFGNFIIGSGVLLPAGLLNPISTDLSVPVSKAGQLMLVGGIVVAIGAPVFAALTSAIERRRLLAFSLALFAVGHVASAFVSDFRILLVLRGLTMVGAAIFTPQAAATAGLLVTPERRAGVIAFIFIGWSAASVGGIPLASYAASLFGWRMVFAGMGGFCVLAALMVWLTIKPGLFVTPLNVKAWTDALLSPLILMVLLVTALSFSGQMSVLTYIAPVMRDAFAAGPEAISLAFAVYGVAGVLGNSIASRVVSRVGIDRVIAATVCCLVAGLSVIALGFGSLVLALIGIGIWGLGSFASNSLQQSRLVAIAPPLASATVALNTTAVYIGQAVGAALGGWLVTMQQPPSPVIAWTSAALTFLALLVSILAAQIAKRK